MPGSDASTSRRRARSKPAWNKDVTRELFRRMREEGDEEARQQLVMNHLSLVRFLAGKFKNRGEPIEDLVQVGTIGLIKAIDRFDPSRGLEFTTFATPTILGEIKRHFRDRGWSVRVPRRLQELSQKVTQATETLTNELRRTPSVEEIARFCDASVEEVLEAMESSGAYTSVPLEGMGADGEEEPASVLDHYATEDEDLVSTDDRIVLAEAIADFSARERDIIKMRFEDGLTQAEIAERMGVSQVQVSRLLRRTLQRLHDKIDPDIAASKQKRNKSK